MNTTATPQHDQLGRARLQRGALGSLEPGKLADLIVLEKNPLDNFQNNEHILYVMKNGRLYDAETISETGKLASQRML